MNKLITVFILIFAFLIVTPLQSYAATPIETVETGVNKVLATLTDAGFKAKSKDEQVSQLSEVISTIFDFDELSKSTLGREWKKMNAAQQKEFVELFREILTKDSPEKLLEILRSKVGKG